MSKKFVEQEKFLKFLQKFEFQNCASVTIVVKLKMPLNIVLRTFLLLPITIFLDLIDQVIITNNEVGTIQRRFLSSHVRLG